MILVLKADYRILYRISYHRSFNVRIGSTLSDTFEQEQGVPQGSTLSPSLFNIKINNIVKCVNENDSSLYVNDFGK